MLKSLYKKDLNIKLKLTLNINLYFNRYKIFYLDKLILTNYEEGLEIVHIKSKYVLA